MITSHSRDHLFSVYVAQMGGELVAALCDNISIQTRRKQVNTGFPFMLFPITQLEIEQ